MIHDNGGNKERCGNEYLYDGAAYATIILSFFMAMTLARASACLLSRAQTLFATIAFAVSHILSYICF